MKEKTLVILAAGMGSRFGGLKQIEPVGPSGEIIADYSVYDAINTGFTKVVFVIRKEHLDYFKENITKKYEDKIKVEFAFQSLEYIPSDVGLPSTRVKMLGTGHALLVAKDLVKEPFVMINSDDFYGRASYEIASNFLDTSTEEYEYMSVNYPFYLASSKNGKVNRGLVRTNGEYITTIEECAMERFGDKVKATDKVTNVEMLVEKDQAVSLNFYCFKPSIFSFLEKDFDEFIHGEIDDTTEFMLTEVIKKYLKSGAIKFKSAVTSSNWLGVTYKDDLPDLKKSILELVEKGVYPENLWK